MQRRLFLSYIAIIVMLVSITLVSVFSMVRNMVTENLVNSADQAMTRWSSELSSVVNYGRSYILNLSISDQFQNMLRSAADVNNGAVEREDFNQVTGASQVNDSSFLYANSVVLSNIPYMLEVCYYQEDQSFVPLYSSSRQNVEKPQSYPHDNPWVQNLLAQDGSFFWSISSDNANDYIRLSKAVYDTKNWNTILGSVSVDFSYQHIALGILNKLKSQSGIDAFIINGKTGEIIGYNGVSRNIYIPPDLTLSSSYQSSVKGRIYSMVRPITNSDFYIVGNKSLKEVDQLFIKSCTMLLAIAALTILFSMALATFFSRSITRPIRELSCAMKDVQNGDLDIAVSSEYKGEIGELYSSFNHMIQMVNSLIEDNYVTRLNQKQSDLNALQAQINTHFLYNTLDSINWLARDNHVPDISRLVTSLSTLLRTSLNNGSQELPLQRELEHVRCYIDIQNIRFNQLFRAEWQIDEDLLDDIVIKVLLQPLVENAINHGFDREDGDSSSNLLIIRAAREEDFLVLQVKNNGTEIDLKKVEELMADTPGFVPKSYGIQSIRTRLKVYYNDEAVYGYSMEEGGMITASIKIPRAYTNKNKTGLSEREHGYV
ncbi:sensor histidine kinase [Lacrimispora sp.]|uniref:sensor histidine kinase n=1 Tax=Lacrimispora sp. TaxID=2719234 RepID=UPI0034601C83